jgi:hypothetical protein
MGPWSVLGNRSLTQPDYQPDFDAVALPPFRLLRIRRGDYQAAVQATTLDPHIGRQQVSASAFGVARRVLLQNHYCLTVMRIEELNSPCFDVHGSSPPVHGRGNEGLVEQVLYVKG